EGGRERGHGQVQADQDRGDCRDAGVGLVELVNELASVARGEDEPKPDDKEQDGRRQRPSQTARASSSEATTATAVSASDSVLTPRILTPASPWLFSTCPVLPSEPLSLPDSPLSPLPAVAAGCSVWCWCRSIVEPIANS